MKFSLAFFCLALTPYIAGAQAILITDGNSLLGQCQLAVISMEQRRPLTEAEEIEVGDVYGYIAGVIDGGQAVEDADHVQRSYVIPPNVILNQEVRIVKRFMEDNPRCLHLPAARIIVLALKDAFPGGTH